MLLMVEKVDTDAIYNSVNKYVKVNNKYMKDYNKHKESSYLKYWLQIVFIVGVYVTFES